VLGEGGPLAVVGEGKAKENTIKFFVSLENSKGGVRENFAHDVVPFNPLH
jgi:hypothetical protein